MFRNPAVKFHLRSNLKAIAVVYLVMGIVYVALTVLFATSFGQEGEPISIGGAGMATSICLLVVGTTIVNEDLPLLAAFGMSRKSQFRSALFSLAVTVLAVALFETVASLLLSLVLPYQSMFVQVEGISSLLFGNTSLDINLLQRTMQNYYSVGTQLTSVLWYACYYAMCFSIGFFFAAMFKFVPHRYKPFAIAGVISFFILLLPYINQLTGNGLFRAIAMLFGEGALRHSLFYAGAAAVLLGGGYLFFRRLQLYTARK